MHERDTERSPFGRPGFLVSAVLLGMLVLAALFVVIGPAGRSIAAANATPSLLQAGSNQSRVRRDVSCTLPAGSHETPSVGPPLWWVSVGQMLAPQAPGVFGPQRRQDGIGVCFAHNPTGALLAAINFFAEATVASPTDLIQTLTAGPGRGIALAQARASQDQLLQNSDGDPGSVQVAGYEFIDYTPAQANLDVVLEGPGGQLAAVECQLDWQSHDWKFVIPVGGRLVSSQVTSMDGFVSWTAGGRG